MGRAKIPIDSDAVLSLREEGWTLEEIAEELHVGTATLSRRLSYLRHNEGTLTKYRELQHLRVTDLSAKVLDSLEEELPELNPEQKIKLLGVLTRSEAQFKDRDEKPKGLVELIVEMEKKKEREKAIQMEKLDE